MRDGRDRSVGDNGRMRAGSGWCGSGRWLASRGRRIEPLLKTHP